MKVVYFIQPTNGGPIRVGTSGDADCRSIALGAWHPSGVEIIATLPGSYAREAAVHRLFASVSLGRDWFKSCSLVWRFISDVEDGLADWLPAEKSRDEMIAAQVDFVPRIKAAFGSVGEMAKVCGYSSATIYQSCASNAWAVSSRVYAALALREADLRGLVPPYLRFAIPRPSNEPSREEVAA